MAENDWIDRLCADLRPQEEFIGLIQADHLVITREELRAAIQTYLGEGAMAILAERLRQVEVENWTAEHDRHHKAGTLASAAAAYIYAGSIDTAVAAQRISMLSGDAGGPRSAMVWSIIVQLWPWGKDWWKPRTPHRDLVRGGALLLAELDARSLRGEQL